MAITGTFSAGNQVQFTDVEIDLDQLGTASTWNAVESWGTNLVVSGGDTPVTDFKTYTTPVIFTGEKNPYQFVVTMLFTNTSTDPWQDIMDDYLAGTDDYDIRYYPTGSSTSGGQIITSSGGKLVDVGLPQRSANDANAVEFSITIRASSIAVTQVA